MNYSIKELKEIIDGKFIQYVKDEMLFYIIFDTRRVYQIKNALFITFQGASADGHQYIHDAYEKGIRNFLISKKVNTSLFPDANFVLIKNTIEALQSLALFHRSKFDYPVIGVTGSAGKTSVKEWIYQLLTPQVSVVKTPRSYNSSIGVPISILGMKNRHDMGLFEAGPDGPNQMEKLAQMIKCNIGVFTNIGDAHRLNYESISQKALEKVKLFKEAEIVIFNSDYSEIDMAITSIGVEKWSWSRQKNDSIIKLISEQILENGKSILSIKFKENQFDFEIPYHDKASIENAMHGIALMLYLDKPIEEIRQKLKELTPISMRLELKDGLNNCVVINDSYSTDLDSFAFALGFLEQQSPTKEKTLIITDFVHSDMRDENLYKHIATHINTSSINRVISIGSSIKNIGAFLENENYVHYYDTIDLLNDLWINISFQNESILIKGARRFDLNRLADRLYNQTHNTVLEINMYSLSKNLKLYSSTLQPNTKMLVMVKASAYGAGSAEVARMLEYNNVDYLSVAYADEGISLRKEGIKLPILVLNPEIPQFENYSKYNLEPEIFNIRTLKYLLRHLDITNEKIKIHLKVETGMNRLGFTEDDIPQLLDLLKDQPLVEVASIFSHLSSTGDIEFDDFTHNQVSRFKSYFNKISETLGYSPMKHVLNSAGIIRFPEYHFDMVRLGAGLYGIDSYMPYREKISTVLTFKARIAQIKKVKKGESIGYSRTYQAPKDMNIAVVSIGYADGLPRTVGNGKFAFIIGGKKAKIVGAIAMDMCMVDITHIPNIVEEDEVIIFGPHYPVEILAKAAGTIAYEIFTSVSGRVKRIYFH